MKMKQIFYICAVICSLFLSGCWGESSQSTEARKVDKQNDHFSIAQPIPFFNHSIERDMLIKIFHARNEKVATHSLWRSNNGFIEDDCASLGFGLPYDVSLTNPLTIIKRKFVSMAGWVTGTVEQQEPNGVYASKNTNATWVMCVNEAGSLDPIYVESKVTVYPYNLEVDYDTNRVKKAGTSSYAITLDKKK